ncbi:MAG: hypothetical protein WC683_08630 [bacterium]
MRPGQRLEELGLATHHDSDLFTWNEKGQAIAEHTGIMATAALVREVECMSMELLDELEARWLRNASN